MDRSDTPKFIDALNDEDVSVRTSAIDMLEKIGDEHALKPLFYVACFDEDEGQMIDMGEYGLRTFPLRDKAREAINHITSRIGEPAIEPLLDLLADTNDDYRTMAANLLGSISSNKAIQSLVIALRDKTRNVRDAAHTALTKIRHPDSTEPLITFLESKDSEERIKAIELLGVIKDKRAVNPLSDVVNKDSEIEVRIEAAWALYQMGDDRGQQYINSLVDELLRVYNYPYNPRYPAGNDLNSIKRIHIIGFAFYRFGGIALMKQAFKQFKKTVNKNYTLYHDLDERWEGIGGWSVSHK